MHAKTIKRGSKHWYLISPNDVYHESYLSLRTIFAPWILLSFPREQRDINWVWKLDLQCITMTLSVCQKYMYNQLLSLLRCVTLNLQYQFTPFQCLACYYSCMMFKTSQPFAQFYNIMIVILYIIFPIITVHTMVWACSMQQHFPSTCTLIVLLLMSY